MNTSLIALRTFNYRVIEMPAGVGYASMREVIAGLPEGELVILKRRAATCSGFRHGGHFYFDTRGGRSVRATLRGIVSQFNRQNGWHNI